MKIPVLRSLLCILCADTNHKTEAETMQSQAQRQRIITGSREFPRGRTPCGSNMISIEEFVHLAHTTTTRESTLYGVTMSASAPITLPSLHELRYAISGLAAYVTLYYGYMCVQVSPLPASRKIARWMLPTNPALGCRLFTSILHV